MRARPESRLGRALVTATLGVALTTLAWGCGDDDSTTTATTTTTSTASAITAAPRSRSVRKGDKPPKPRSQDKPSAAAEVKAKIAGYRSCLERQGAKPGSLPAPSGNSDGLGSLPKDVQERIAKLRQAAAACGDRLPKGAPIGDDPGSGLRKLREDAKQRFKGVQTFRDCMGRHGYGPTANGTKPSGSLKQAFDDCRPAGQ